MEPLFEVNIIVYKLSDTSPPSNLFDGLWARAPTPCTSIYMKHTSHSFAILRRIVIHTDAASVKPRCGNIRPGWNDTNNGGVYHTTPSVFLRLDDDGIPVVDTLRYYPYRATFDFECFFDGDNLPADSDRSSRSAECESGFQRAGGTRLLLVCHMRRL